jgi:hypothetical protein
MFVCERERTSSIWVWLGALALPLYAAATRRHRLEQSNESKGSLQQPTIHEGRRKCRHTRKLAFFCLLLLFCRTASTNFCFRGACVFQCNNDPQVLRVFFYYTIPLILLLVEYCTLLACARPVRTHSRPLPPFIDSR